MITGEYEQLMFPGMPEPITLPEVKDEESAPEEDNGWAQLQLF